MVLDREMEDKQDKDLVDLNTKAYKGNEDNTELTNNVVTNIEDEGIARFTSI